MNTMKFKIKNSQGDAVIATNYNEGTIYVENNLPGQLGTLKTNKIGISNGYDIYENYYDVSNNADYAYFAIKMS